MRGLVGSLFAAVLLLLPASPVLSGEAASPPGHAGVLVEPVGEAAPLGLLPHPKILIHGDAMFRLGPVVGVLNPLAAGTPDDPFVISGWDVFPDAGIPVDPRASEWLGNIHIENTTKSFVVRDSYVHGHHSPPPSDPFWSALQPVATQVDGLAAHLGMRFSYAGIQLTNAPNGRVENVTIADNDVGLLVQGSPGLVLNNLTVHANAVAWSPAQGAGIVVNTSAGVRVEGGSVTDEPEGIFVSWSDGAQVLGVELARDADAGVQVEASSGGLIAGNDAHGGALGIRVEASFGLVLAGNDAHDDAVGLDVRGSNADLRDNRASNDSVAGLRVAASLVTLERNTLEANRVGAQVAGSKVQMAGDAARRNSAEGLRLADSYLASSGDVADDNGAGVHLVNSGGTFSSLEATGNRGHGVFFDGAGGGVEGSTVAGNGGDGVRYVHSGGGDLANSVRGSTVSGNGGDGVSFDNASSNYVGNDGVFQSTITDNGGDGVRAARMPSGITVEGSLLARNGGWGANLFDLSSGCQVADDVVSGNPAGGIRLDRAAGGYDPHFHARFLWATVANDKVLENGGNGVDVENSSFAALQGVNATGNAGWGARLVGSTQVTVTDSWLARNQAGGTWLDHDGALWFPGSLVERTLLDANGGPGLYADATQMLHTHGNTVTGNRVGYVIAGSGSLGNPTYVEGDQIAGNLFQGAVFEDDDNVAVAGNLLQNGTYEEYGLVVEANGAEGLRFERVDHATVGESVIRDSPTDGIVLEHSPNFTLGYSDVHGNRDAGLRANASNELGMWNNHLVGNGEGAVLAGSSGGFLYNNYFDNLVRNAHDDNPGANTWYEVPRTFNGVNILGGQYIGGNYWSDYAGVDLNGDGLGDTEVPYRQPGGDPGDLHPLVPS